MEVYSSFQALITHPTPVIPWLLHPQAYAILTRARTVGRAPRTLPAGICARALLTSEAWPAR